MSLPTPEQDTQRRRRAFERALGRPYFRLTHRQGVWELTTLHDTYDEVQQAIQARTAQAEDEGRTVGTFHVTEAPALSPTTTEQEEGADSDTLR